MTRGQHIVGDGLPPSVPGLEAPPAALNPVAKALGATLISPNEADSNGEAANVVDGLFAIARAIDGLASAIRDT